jgi:Tfp pilus assembly protein PilO
MPIRDEYDDEDPSYCGGTTTEGNLPESTEERDEIKEVMKMSQKDTRRVIIWRFAVTIMLLVTAVAVTGITYKFLLDEQQEDMQSAVS